MKDGMIQGWQNQRPHMKDVVNKQRQHSYSPKVNVCLNALRNEALRERPSLKLLASRPSSAGMHTVSKDNGQVSFRRRFFLFLAEGFAPSSSSSTASSCSCSASASVVHTWC